MNLDALVKKGCRPWRPNFRVRSVDVWHEYDIPTAGVLKLDEADILFTSVGLTDERISVWAYTYLSEVEAKLASVPVDSVEALGSLIDNAFMDRDAVFALADNLEIAQWSPMRVGSDLMETATEFLGQLLETVQRERNPAERFQARLAEVEAVAEDLVSA